MIGVKNQKAVTLYSSFRYFFVAQLFFGFDYGFAKPNSIFLKLILKFLCLSIAGTISVTLIKDSLDVDNLNAIWYYMYIIEYCSYVTIIYFSKFSNYFKSFLNLDLTLNLPKAHYSNLQIRALTSVSFTICLRFLYGYLFCKWVTVISFKCLPSTTSLMASTLALISVDVVRVFLFIMRYCIYYRLKTIRLLIEYRYASWQIKKRKDCMKYNFRKFRELYKTLADIVDSLKPNTDAMVSFFSMTIDL